MRAALPYVLMFAVVLLLTLLDVGDVVDRWTIGLIVFIAAVGWFGRRR